MISSDSVAKQMSVKELAQHVERVLSVIEPLDEYEQLSVLGAAYRLRRSSMAPRTFEYLKEL